jgi:hypothetical protein
MSDPSICIYIIDSHGLRELVSTQSNSLRSLCFELLKKGIIAVPTCVWDEFYDAFDDEAEVIADWIAKKIAMNKRYYAGAAQVADQLNSGFSGSTFDSTTDYFAASIAMTDGVTLITTAEQMPFYKKVRSCNAIDIKALSST